MTSVGRLALNAFCLVTSLTAVLLFGHECVRVVLTHTYGGAYADIWRLMLDGQMILAVLLGDLYLWQDDN